MTRWPRVDSVRIERALARDEFRLLRQKGSHRVWRNDAGRYVTVPQHAGKTLGPRLLRYIMNQAGWTIDDLRRLL